jgi:hypothetical protein
MQNATIRRLRSNLFSFRKAEKDRLYKERQQEIISRQMNITVPTVLKKHDIDNRSKKVIFLERVRKMMEEDPSFSKMGKKKQAQTIVDAIYRDEMLAGERRGAFLHTAKKHNRKNVFPSQTVLEHMDNDGGVLNSAGVELVRTMEKASLPASKQRRFYRVSLPSKAPISVVARKVEFAAANIIPFQTFSTASGEGVKFTNLPNVIQTIIRAH